MTIRNLKNPGNVKGGEIEVTSKSSANRMQLLQNYSTTNSHIPAKSPQSRQGGMQVQGQGKMESARLSAAKQSQQAQAQQKLRANQMMLMQKLHPNQRQPSNEDQQTRSRKERR